MNVPKFGSFKPKVSKPSPPDAVRQDTRDRASRNSKRPSRDSTRPDKRHRSRSRDRVTAVGPTLPSRSLEVENGLYVLDKRGDEKNLVYGGLHRYDVALYRRIGAGSVLGVKKDLKIRRDLSNEKSIVLSSSHLRANRSREKYVFSKMEKPRLLRIRPDVVDEVVSHTESNFILLENHPGRKRRKLSQDTPNHSDTDDEKKHYRSIEGKAKNGELSDEDVEYVSDKEETGLANDETTAVLRKQNIELSRRVESDPHDVAAWLAFIEHQDSFLYSGEELRRTTNAELQSTAEIKIHIYEKALGSAKSLKDKELLLSGLMAEGTKIWESNEQLRKWEEIARQNLESLSLWKQYLNFRQSTFTTFQFEEIRELLTSRFQLLQRSIPDACQADTELLTKQIIYVFLRYTLFCQQSGYTELALSLWQAVLEINFRAPKIASSFDWKSSFGEYWESEVARIGENGSAGWASYCTRSDNHDDLPARIDDAPLNVSRENTFYDWTIAERRMQKNALTPARTLDETVEDDPFRVILFSDIEDFLYIFPKSSDSHKRLLNAYLLFCRSTPLGRGDSELFEDAFVVGISSHSSVEALNVYDLEKASVTGGIENILDLEPRNYHASVETYFSPFWFKHIPRWKQDLVACHGVSYLWFRTTLHHLLDIAFTDDLGEYVLAFEWRNEPETIKKFAKTLIKKHSDRIRLYNAYAMIEWTRGNKDTASGVFMAAIYMARSMLDDIGDDAILLWRSWIWCYLEDGDTDAALKHLLCISDGVVNAALEVGPTAIIRTKQYLTSKRDHLLHTNSTTNALIFAELVALLAYLISTDRTQPQSNSQGSIMAYLTEITSHSKSLTSRKSSESSHHEWLLQSSARLFFNHARAGPFQPALLRSTMQQYLTHFPSNSIFLSIFEWNEARFRIEGRVRAFFNTQPKLTLSQHIFRIHHESKVGTIHSVRAAFEHAVDVTSAARSNAGIWRLYVFFMAKNFRDKTKDVWYRALRACPWVKELYIVGFEVLGKEVDGKELMGTWRALGEKGLRIHVDLEEIFEDM